MPLFAQELARKPSTAPRGGGRDAAREVEGTPPAPSPLRFSAGNVPVQREGAPAPDHPQGLPPNLRRSMEAMSGVALDDVRVKRDSPEAARVGALAYARGKEIHLGPGQERHLPHEAWHVVQQKQGRVRANGDVNGVPLNDSEALEREADRMGRRAGSASPPKGFGAFASTPGPPVTQRVLELDDETKETVKKGLQTTGNVIEQDSAGTNVGLGGTLEASVGAYQAIEGLKEHGPHLEAFKEVGTNPAVGGIGNVMSLGGDAISVAKSGKALLDNYRDPEHGLEEDQSRWSHVGNHVANMVQGAADGVGQVASLASKFGADSSGTASVGGMIANGLVTLRSGYDTAHSLYKGEYKQGAKGALKTLGSGMNFGANVANYMGAPSVGNMLALGGGLIGTGFGAEKLLDSDLGKKVTGGIHSGYQALAEYFNTDDDLESQIQARPTGYGTIQ